MTNDPAPAEDPRSIRLAHVRYESDVKSVGQLCYLVAAFGALGTLEFLLIAVGVLPYDPSWREFATPPQIQLVCWIFTLVMFLNTVVQWALGHGLVRLLSWARWTVVALTGLSLVSGIGLSLGLCFVYPGWGLLGLVIGLVLHGLILYPLLTPRAGMVFSKDYKRVIRATPEIRSRMHPLLKWFLGTLLVAVGLLSGYLLALYLRIID